MDNTHNKSELIHLLSSTFRKHHITVEQCDNDADTSIVREALAAASDCSIEVRTFVSVVNITTGWSTVGNGLIKK